MSWGATSGLRWGENLALVHGCVTLYLPTDSGGRQWNVLVGRLAASATNGCKKGALLSQRMAEKLTVRLHPLAWDRAEEVAFGRWLRNEAVTVEEIHQHCGQEITARTAGRHVLAIQDTTELNYQRHAGRTRGLGTVGNGTDLGLFLHPTLAIDANDHHCLGLVGAQVYVRREGATVNRRKRTIEEKESYRWLQGVETADQVLKEAAHVTHVQDREGDIYEQFARPRAAHSDLVIRICQDRKLTSDEMLFAAMSAMPVVHRFRLTLKAQPGKRKTRTAKLELRFGKVTIARPAHLSARAAATSDPARGRRLRIRCAARREAYPLAAGDDARGQRYRGGLADRRMVSPALEHRAIVLGDEKPGLRHRIQPVGNRRRPDEARHRHRPDGVPRHAAGPRPRRPSAPGRPRTVQTRPDRTPRRPPAPI